MKKISQGGVNFIKTWEGQELTAYNDGTGVETIGVGHTGPDVHPGEHITLQEEEALLRGDLSPVEAVINSFVHGDISQGQFDALCSLGFNIGSTGLRASSAFHFTILGAAVHGDDAKQAAFYKQAAESFILWNRAGGKVLIGLSDRRKAEANFYRPNTYNAEGNLSAPPTA